VQFRRAFGHGLSRDPQRVVDVMSIGVGLTRRAKETAELAIDITDVCRIEVTIDVEISRPAMFSAPYGIGKFTQRVEIVCGKEGYAIFERKTFAVINFRANVIKSDVV
jgi:hypothetical protein